MQMIITPLLIQAIRVAAKGLQSSYSDLETNVNSPDSTYEDGVKQALLNCIEENKHHYAILAAWLARVDKSA